MSYHQLSSIANQLCHIEPQYKIGSKVTIKSGFNNKPHEYTVTHVKYIPPNEVRDAVDYKYLWENQLAVAEDPFYYYLSCDSDKYVDEEDFQHFRNLVLLNPQINSK